MRLQRTILTAFAVSLVISPNLIGGETFTDAKAAGMLFELQGEYLGVIDAWDGNWGAQVVAKSKQDLELHLLKGGLPGAGTDSSIPSKSVNVRWQAPESECRATSDGIQYILKPSRLTILKVENGKSTMLGELTKVIRESKTLGLKPPTGAVTLFDGEATNDFEGAEKEGTLLTVGGTSKSTFGKHRLHIEFRTPFQPEDSGQKRGNSGAYVQGRYEVQILDSFGLEGEDNECGGIYKMSKPKVNMCYPPLSWQTYDIEFTPARYDKSGMKTTNASIRVEHNGVVIHERLELTSATPGKNAEGPGNGPLFLQNHSNPVRFRNVWAVRLPDE